MKTNHFKFFLKQCLKMFIQGVFLPVVYELYRSQPVIPKRVVFADAHHLALPFSMEEMHRRASDAGFEVIDYLDDYTQMSLSAQLKSMVGFMKLYATAHYVFICDYYLPAASCRKKWETVLIQLWHSGGLMKKAGFDAPEDIPPFYRLNPHKNYDLMTVSAPCVADVLTKAMHLRDGVAQPTGISRSDVYFSSAYQAACRERLEQAYPDSRGKKIILWAPTFRGNAAAPWLAGTEAVCSLQKELGGHYLVLIKGHPNIDRHNRVSNCEIPSEQLLPVTDLLITDYSSILFDYIIYEKPFVLFAPDYQEYAEKRGFYIDYFSLPAPVVTDGDRLAEAVRSTLDCPDTAGLARCREYHMGSCDGHATQRIWEQITNCERETSC